MDRHQLAACTDGVLPGPDKLLQWSVPHARRSRRQGLPSMAVVPIPGIAPKPTEDQPFPETEHACMANSPRLTRRSLLTAAAAVAALKLHPARAQTTAEPGCSIG